MLNSLDFSGHCFVRIRADETILPPRRNHFPVLAQMSGNSRLAIRLPTRRRALPATDNRRQSDADHQLHPRLCLHPGWSLDGWFFRPEPAGCRYVSPIMARRLRPRHPSRSSWPPSERGGCFAKKSPIKALHVRTHLFCCSSVVLPFRWPGAGAGPDCSRRRPRSVPCSKCPIRAASSCGFARPIWSDAGRIPKAFAVVCTTMPPRPWKTPTCAKRCCAASARPECRRSRPPGCRASKQSEIGPTFTKIAKPTLQCMFEPATNQ